VIDADGGDDAFTRLRRPRDAQRARLYQAETIVPSSPLPGLAACASFAEKVVGSLWWVARFPECALDSSPRLRPGNGARQAFYREDTGGPSITLPRRYRTKGVVLHELTHWALSTAEDLPHHGTTFARVLVDATAEFCGSERALVLEQAYRDHRVRMGNPARAAQWGRLEYGDDERRRILRSRARAARVQRDPCA
jgi:putative metallohydrolase (TIGR04338 family)